MEINQLIDAALQRAHSKKSKRNYLGASRLGEPCARKLQYEFLNAKPNQEFNGQQLCVFAMGHYLETLVVEWLQQAGFVIQARNEQGEQFSFTVADGRISGHIDGIITSAPEGYNYPALFECKTMNAKAWRETVKHGIAVSRPVYFAQVQLYMAYMQLTEAPALLTVLNKDTAELYHEWVSFAADVAQKYSDRAVQILQACDAGEMLPRLSQDQNFFMCKLCNYNQTCFGGL
jgi:PD-(D/E)XK nuclease superfamily